MAFRKLIKQTMMRSNMTIVVVYLRKMLRIDDTMETTLKSDTQKFEPLINIISLVTGTNLKFSNFVIVISISFLVRHVSTG